MSTFLTMRWASCCACLTAVFLLFSGGVVAQVNYAEALQKSIYFYDIQRSGVHPSTYGYAPGQNRVRWQSDQHTYDGYDLQLPPGGMTNGLGQLITDANKAGALQGGFRDAGDHPKWAASIGYATSMLTWTAVEHYDQLVATGQLPYLLENIKWATDYMMRSILFTDANNPDTYRIVAIVSDYRAEHGVAAYSGNITLRVPQRPHYYADKDAPNTPQVALYASSLAAASVVFRRAGNTAYADLLYTNVARLHAFMAQYRGISRIKKADGTIVVTERQPNQAYYDAYAPGFAPNRMPEVLDFATMPNLAIQYRGTTEDPAMTLAATTSSLAPAASNHILPQSVQTDWGNYYFYSQRSLAEIVRTISDESAFAHIWMHEAEKAKNGATPLAAAHLSKAVQFFNNILTDIVPRTPVTTTHGEASVVPREVLPLRGSGLINYETFAAILLNRLVPGDSRYAEALENTLDFIVSRPKSPGGLTYAMGRPSDQYPQGGSAADPFEAWGVFEQLTPRMFVALTFAKDINKPNKRNTYIAWAESQVAYIFGNNPQKRNFFTGMNISGCLNEDIGLHANGLGSWGGFDERIPGTVSYVTENRNRLIGALIGGPRWDDTRPNAITDPARYTEVATFYQPCFTGVLASMVGRYGGTPLPADFPKAFLPDVNNDGNGDDIPSPIPSNSNWACQEFPVHARQEATHSTPAASTTAEVRITVNNRSRWPARAATAMSARYYFTLEPGITVTELRLRNPYINITGVSGGDSDLYGDADGATFENATDGITLLSGASAMSKVVEVSADGAGRKLCYVEIFFRNPTTASYNYLFDDPSVVGGRYAPRVVANPLLAAQNFLSNITPTRPDLNVVWPGGPYQVRNPIGWAKRHELRHAVVRLTFSAASDLTNDWSFAQLPTRTAFGIPSSQAGNAPYMPVYENGVLLCGNVPSSPAEVPPLPAPPPSPTQDYGKALQRALYFFEAQRSGNVSAGLTLPNGTTLPNRVAWRGNSHTAASTNGGDAFPGADLVGGLYEGGNDYTKSAVAMAHAASLMAWSYYDYPAAYNSQPELQNSMLGNLKWIADFFKDKCLTFTDGNDESTYKIYLFVTDRLADNSRHDEWAAAEVIDKLPASRRPVRRFFYADKDAPYISHVSSMAAALAAASRTFRAVGGMDAYSDELLLASRRMYNFCYRYTYGADKMLNYTTAPNFVGTSPNFRPSMTTSGATIGNGNVFGVAKDMAGNLVRIEPYDTDGNPANGIQPVTDAIATRFEFASGTSTTTGSLYDPPVPDYYEFTNPTSGSGTSATYSPTDTRILGWIHDNMSWAAIWLHLAEQGKASPNLNGPSSAPLLNEAVGYARHFMSDVSGDVGGATASGVNLIGSPVDYKLYASLLLFRLNAKVTEDFGWWPNQYRDRLRHFFMGGHLTSGPSGNVPVTVTPASPAVNKLITHANLNGGLFNFSNNRLRGNGSLRPIIEASLAAIAFARYIDLNSTTVPANVIAPADAGYTATWANLRDRLMEIGQRNVNGVMGDNTRRLSFMYGYHSGEIPGMAGVTGMRYMHHRTAAGYFAGVAHRTFGTNSLANPPATHILYGGIAGGPDNNFLNQFQTEGGSQTDANTRSRAAGNWTAQSNEPRLYYTAPMVYALAALNPTGAGTLTANFPEPVNKPLEYSVAARVVSTSSTASRLRVMLSNQTRWPARGADDLRLRYYFTLEAGALLGSTTVNGHDAAPAPTVSSPVLVSGNLYYVEIAFTGNPIYPMGVDATRSNTYTPTGTLPNSAQFHRRTIDFTLNYTGPWNNSDDWSYARLGLTDFVTQQIPVYNGTTLINGNEPGLFDMEVWSDVDDNGTLATATDVKLNGTGQAVDFGFIAPSGTATRNVLLKNTSSAPITISQNWSVPMGFRRVGSGDLLVPAGEVRSITFEMLGTGNVNLLSGTALLFNNGANSMENPLNINLRGSIGIVWNGNAWSPALPTANDDVLIASGSPNQPPSFTVNNLTIGSGVDMWINSGVTATINGILNYNGNITVQSGGSLVQTEGSTLGTIAGTFKAQRNVSNPALSGGTTFAYNYWGSPVQAQAASLLNGSSFRRRYTYHEPTGAWRNSDNGITPNVSQAAFPNFYLHPGNTLIPGVGYTSATNLASLTREFTGMPNNGNIVVNTSWLSTGSFAGYNFVGNPYASALLIADNNAGTTGLLEDAANADFEASAYVFVDSEDGRGTGSYRVVNAAGAQGNHVAAMQGFFVVRKATAPTSGNLTFRNAHRVGGNNADANFYRGEATSTEHLSLTLRRTDRVADNVALALADNFSDDYEAGRDAKKLDANNEMNLAARWNGERLAQLAIGKKTSLEIPLVLNTNRTGEHTFAAENLPTATSLPLFLEDRATGEFYYLQAGREHKLNIAAGRYDNRFFIRTIDEAAKGASAQAAGTQVFSHGRELFVKTIGNGGTLRIFNLMGVELWKAENVQANGLARFTVPVQVSGIYVVKYTDAQGSTEAKVWLEK